MTRRTTEELHTHWANGGRNLRRQSAAMPRLTTNSPDSRISKDGLSKSIGSVYKAPELMDTSFEQTSRKGLIGIITSTFESAYHGRMMEQASTYFNERGYDSIFVSHANNKSVELNAISSLDELECDGLIVFSSSLDNEELAAYFDSHPASVLINHYLPEYHDRCVYLDNMCGGRLAAQYLIDMEHTAIAMVTGPAKDLEVQERSRGFLSVLEDHVPGLKPVMTLAGELTFDYGAKTIEKIVESKETITAVFFQNDNMALGALEKCHQLGIDVPNELSIIGFDDLIESRHTFPALTTIHQPIKKMGRAAAQLICSMLEPDKTDGAPPDTQTFFWPVLMERETVKRKRVPEANPRITEREIECLQWASIGKTAWEISMILGISERTVGFHLTNAATKFEANNRTHAVSIALKKGLITG